MVDAPRLRVIFSATIAARQAISRAYWDTVFAEGEARYGFLKNTVPTPEERRVIADFFFWTAWAAGTPRPGLSYTYTNTWPPDRSVGNAASTEALLWSILSIIALGNWRVVPDAIIILLGAFPLLYFLITTFPRLRAATGGKP